MGGDATESRLDERLDKNADVQRAAAAIPSIKLGAILGCGGMAVVYDGLDLGFNPPRRVAVKLMDPRLSADPDFRLRFEREASVAASFRQDNIVRVYASGESGGTKYIVMEYLGGGTLAERIAKGPLPVTESLRIGYRLAAALAYLHAEQFVHRDFKPLNVLFTTDNNPVLSDFGIAKPTALSDVGVTKGSMIVGAPRYMAPEQAVGDRVTDRADIYSFGLTLTEMFTARLPELAARTLASANSGTEIRRWIDPLSPTAAQLICRCLLLDPAARPSARECVSELARATSEFELKIQTRRRRRLLGLGAAALLVLGSVGFVFRQHVNFSQPSPPPRAVPEVAADTIQRGQLKPLFESLGIPAANMGDKPAYTHAEVNEIISTAPRRVSLGSTQPQIQAALDLCNHYSRNCALAMYEDETPRTVTLTPFQLDTSAVTVADFRRFAEATNYTTDVERAGAGYALDDQNQLQLASGGNWRNAVGEGSAHESAAVVGVSFQDAQKYCQWKQQRLPTEAEWEYAARGPEQHIFPWGDDVTPALTRVAAQPLALEGVKGGIGGIYYGMSGHVWEWVDTEVDGKKLLKGGSWRESNPANKRAAARRFQAPIVPAFRGDGSMQFGDSISGFRCAASTPRWPDTEFWYPSR